ncbi:IMP4 U3 small nucleolar ribonucleoprotein [Cryptosporidium ryanae]|uniref:IMP4 U3 small nucleolar ribonucleoprotein n=1 Tax=Cryptosporidium ryanae TaxID=515981 RepID=UPI00351A9E95|nr:IMP4 U3 small nucleolar ribonucleoprotein [Cryptosporidium ryanae]
MIRRNARQRKEYILSKNLELLRRKKVERTIKLKEAIENGRQIPTELRGISDKLLEDIDLTDTYTNQKSFIDNEYLSIGPHEPKILITTSRNPSNRLIQFVKELSLIIPNSSRINRGGYVLKEFSDLCRSNGATDLIIIHEHRGEPDSMIVSHFPHGPTAYFSLNEVVLRHDLPNKLSNVPQSNPHLIFQNFNTDLGQRVCDILKHLFPTSTSNSQRVISFVNVNDQITFRNYVWEKKDNQLHEDVQIIELGPRFILKLYKIELGTVEMRNLSTEWVHRPFFNKRKLLL